jgi:cysteinyl-tRNA synthetase
MNIWYSLEEDVRATDSKQSNIPLDASKRLETYNAKRASEAAIELAAWEQVNLVLGIGSIAEAETPAEIIALLEARQAARKAKDFKRSDEIRDELKAKGWVVEDSPKGPKLKKI